VKRIRWRNGRSLHVLLILSVLANVAGLACAARVVQRRGGLRYLMAKLGPRAVHPSGFHTRCGLFALLPDSPDDVYFVGDSIIQAAEIAELFGPDARNRGVAGDTTVGVLDRLDEIVAGRPREVYLMIGINDLQNGNSIPDIVCRYRRIIERLRERSTSTYVHIQSVLPIHPERYRLSILPDYPHITVPTRELVARLNEHLRQLATDFRDLEYIDLSTLCDDAGWLRGEYTDDGLHLNGPGIVAWARTLRETAHAQISQAAGQ